LLKVLTYLKILLREANGYKSLVVPISRRAPPRAFDGTGRRSAEATASWVTFAMV